MQDNDDEHGRERQQFEKAMDMLLDRCDAPLLACERRVPQGRQLMQHKTDDHGCNNESVDFEKYRRQQRNANLSQHQEMKKGFLVPARQLDPCSSMTKVIGKPCQQPKREDKVQQDGFGCCGMRHELSG